jgi:hypothetical protein
MSDIPNPWDAQISSHALVLGFAYSLTPKGLPGQYNEKIAKQLNRIIRQARGLEKDQRPWIGMQWEIFDAIEREWKGELNELLSIVPLSHVGGPPLFSKKDIGSPKVIVNLLKTCYEDRINQLENKKLTKASTQAGRILAEKVANLLIEVGYEADQSKPTVIFDAAMFDETKLAQYFNRLIEAPHFHQDFYDEHDQAVLELHNLYRTNVGSVGVEKRELPDKNKMLRRFQRIRVNRFMIEAIFPDDKILKRGEYLSTRGVLDQVTHEIEREGGREIKYAYVYGHPEHSPRCRRQLIESAWAAGWNLEPENVYDMANRLQEDWEENRWDWETAQMWCRSKQNWDDYERMGKTRLD